MGLSSSPKSTSTSYSGSSNPAFAPYAIQGVNTVNSVYNQAAPGLKGLTDLTQGSLVPQLFGQNLSASGAANQGTAYNSDVLSGKYLNSGNPYLQDIMNQTNDNIFNTVGSHFSTTGRYGSGANQAVLAKQIANADNQLQYQNYSDERNNMAQAAGASQQASTADLAGLLQTIAQGAQLPYTGSESLANSLGSLFAGGQDKSVQKGPNPIWGALGQGLGAAAAFASDRRLKSNIVKVGEFADGLGVYDYNIDGQRQRGVMADEVQQLRPWAYIPNFVGEFAGVDYGIL